MFTLCYAVCTQLLVCLSVIRVVYRPHQLFAALKGAAGGTPEKLLAAVSLLPDGRATAFDIDDGGDDDTANSERRRHFHYQPLLCNDLALLFYTVFSYELMFADDADIFTATSSTVAAVSITGTGTAGSEFSPLMSADNTRLLISVLRETLFRWCWTGSDGSPGAPVVAAGGDIPVVQRLLIGLVDKQHASNSFLVEENSCGGELLLLYQSLCHNEISDGAHLQPSELPLLSKVHVVVKLFNQLYERHCRFYRRQTHAEAAANEMLWLWPNTFFAGPTGAVVVVPTLSTPSTLSTGTGLLQVGVGTGAGTGAAAGRSDLRSLMSHDGSDERDILAYAAGYGPLVGSVSTSLEGIASTTGKVSFAAACLFKAVVIMLPQVIPFQRRVSVFECLLKHDRAADMRHSLSHRDGGGSAVEMMMQMMQIEQPFHSGPGIGLRVRRSHVLEDSFATLEADPVNRTRMKNRMQVEFVSEDGHRETGIDGGGLFKEFIDLFLKTAFDPATSHLFLPTTEQWLVSS